MNSIRWWRVTALAVLCCSPATLAALERTLTTVAGFGRHDGPIESAWIGKPLGLAFLPDGSLLFADWSASAIRRIDLRHGAISTGAGGWAKGFSGDGGPAAQALVNAPSDFTVGAHGLVYLSDFANQRVRVWNTSGSPRRGCGGIKVGPGQIATVAGSGEQGYSGTPGPALQAGMAFPRGITVWQGDVIFADIDDLLVQRVHCDTGLLETVAGNGLYGVGDFDGSVLVYGPDGFIGRQSGWGDGGPATEAIIDSPASVAVAPDGSLYIAEWGSSMPAGQFGRIRRVGTDGIITTVAGTPSASGGDGAALQAGFSNNISALVFDAAGNLFLTEPDAGNVRRIDASMSTVSTIVGNNYGYSSSDAGGLARKAHITGPWGLAFDSGRLYVADANAGWIRVIEPESSGFVGPDSLIFDVGSRPGPKLPYTIGIDRVGQIFVGPNGEGRILGADRATGGFWTLIDGADAIGVSGTGGPAIAALSGASNGIAADADNNLYFTDALQQRLMRVAATTVPGNPVAMARPTSPITQVADFSGVAGGQFFVTDHLVLGPGVAYVSEPVHGHVYQVSLKTGAIITLAGSGAQDGSGVGGPALQAGLNGPEGLALDLTHHQLFIADSPLQRVWRMDLQAGTIDAIAVNGAFPDCPQCADPRWVALLGGYLFIGDGTFQRVIRIDLDDPQLTQEVVVGPGTFPGGFVADHVPGTKADIAVDGLAVGPDGKLYIVELTPQRIARLGMVDIEPGAFPKVIRLHSARPIPVAILSDYGFDATHVNPATVTVAGARALGAGASFVDVNGDGRLDLVVLVRPDQMKLGPNAREAAVLASMMDGTPFVDADFVKVVEGD